MIFRAFSNARRALSEIATVVPTVLHALTRSLVFDKFTAKIVRKLRGKKLYALRVTLTLDYSRFGFPLRSFRALDNFAGSIARRNRTLHQLHIRFVERRIRSRYERQIARVYSSTWRTNRYCAFLFHFVPTLNQRRLCRVPSLSSSFVSFVYRATPFPSRLSPTRAALKINGVIFSHGIPIFFLDTRTVLFDVLFSRSVLFFFFLSFSSHKRLHFDIFRKSLNIPRERRGGTRKRNEKLWTVEY